MPRLRLLTLIACIGILVAPLFGAKFAWDPVDPSLLGAPAASENLPDLDCLFLRLGYEGEASSAEFKGYCRVKVNTAKGVESSSKLQIDLSAGEAIKEVAARVIRPNGSIDELKDTQFIHSRDKKRQTKKEGKVTFAFPDLTPGDIVEYRWVSVHDFDIGSLWLHVQRPFPVREFEYRFAAGLYNRLVYWVNTSAATSEKKGDTLIVRMKNLEPFIEEPIMPSISDHIVWIGMLPIYEDSTAKEQWQTRNQLLYDTFRENTRPSGAVKELAAKIIGSTTDKKEKLRLLYDYVQTQFMHLRWDSSPEAESVKKKRNEKKYETWNAKTVIAKKMGDSDEIYNLFGALAVAAGLEPREVNYARTYRTRNIRTLQGWAYLTDRTYLFELDGRNFFCSPDDPFLPFGIRPWFEETVSAVIADPKKVSFTTIGVSDPETNRIEQNARLKLDAEGTLTGDVTISFWGQEGWKHKIDRTDEKQEDFDREYIEELHQRLPNAEVSEMRWTDLQTRKYPVVVSYKVRLPNYAEFVGERLVAPLNYFRKGSSNPFTANNRKYPILFGNTVHSVTTIDLELPPGFQPESPTAPQGIGNEKSAISVRYDVKLYPNQNKLTYTRDYVLGRGPGKEFSAEQYPVFKKLFTLLDTADSHVVLLKPEESSTPAAP